MAQTVNSFETNVSVINKFNRIRPNVSAPPPQAEQTDAPSSSSADPAFKVQISREARDLQTSFDRENQDADTEHSREQQQLESEYSREKQKIEANYNQDKLKLKMKSLELTDQLPPPTL